MFHTGNPDSALWEFKHGQGNFKRGDLMGLREIKRRASRHALVHRGEYGSAKPAPSQPGTPAEPMPPMQGGDPGGDPRMAGGVDHTHAIYDLSSRLQRLEDNAHFAHIKQQAAMEAVQRLLHISQEMARAMLSLVPDPSNPVYREGECPVLFADVLAFAQACPHPISIPYAKNGK